MTNRNLDNLVESGLLKRERPDHQEINSLIRSGLARLTDAKNESLNPESRFDLAYNAAHALSLAALRRAGYRSHRRYVVFQCLTHTLGVEDAVWRILDRAHQIRNIAEYEGVADISTSMINAVISAADEVAKRQEDAELR